VRLVDALDETIPPRHLDRNLLVVTRNAVLRRPSTRRELG
jgi:hypothetical protein